MATPNYTKLLESYRREPVRTTKGLRASLVEGEYSPSDFDIGRLFCECFGDGEFRAAKSEQRELHRVYEAGGDVNTSAFLNITGQIVYGTVLEKYKNEDFVFRDKFPERKAITLSGEKIAGITDLGDIGITRKEADPYQVAGVGEDWIFTPQIPDIGRIVNVTWEAVFEDKTGQLLDSCGAVGEWIGFSEEQSAVDCLIDENVTSHRYNWRGTVIASYNDNTGTHTWDNLAATNAIIDWTKLDVAEQLLNQITNPYTGLPVMIEAKDLVVTKQNEQTANRIINATEVSVVSPGYATSANPNKTTMANPYRNKYQVLSTRLLAYRMATDTTWYLGDLSKYAVRMVAEPLSVVQAPPNNEDDFTRRIVARYRANKRWAHTVVQPRAVIKNTA